MNQSGHEKLDFDVWGQKAPPKQQSGGRKRPQNVKVGAKSAPAIRTRQNPDESQYKEITWEDGRKYEITRVKDKRRAASTKAGGVGERYTCVVDGKEIFLFYEDNNMWFMERAGA